MQVLDLHQTASSPWHTIAMRYARANARRQRPQALALAVLSKLPDASGFAAWRGRSGRRYVVTRHALDTELMPIWHDAIVIAVRRDDRSYEATIIGLHDCGSMNQSDAEFQCWVALMKLAGATDLDVHLRLSEPAMRAAAIIDLAP
jgi:hypothetical protein